MAIKKELKESKLAKQEQIEKNMSPAVGIVSTAFLGKGGYQGIETGLFLTVDIKDHLGGTIIDSLSCVDNNEKTKEEIQLFLNKYSNGSADGLVGKEIPLEISGISYGHVKWN